MARIRTVKPDFWEDEGTGSLSLGARLLFIATWNLADDEGLLRWTADYLRAQVFPYDTDITLGRVTKMMAELADGDFIYPYNTAGRVRQKLAYVLNFRKHQRINRPQPAKFPPPNIGLKEVREMYGRRDRMVCGICRGHIEEVTDPWHNEYDPSNGSRYWEQHRQRLSLDHIVPKSKGGGDYPSNIQASHVSCNTGRGNRSLPDSLNHSLNDSPPEGNGREWEGEMEEDGKPLSSSSHLQPSLSQQDDDDDPQGAEVNKALRILAERDLGRRVREKGLVGDPEAWLRTATERRRIRHADAISRALGTSSWKAQKLADHLDGTSHPADKIRVDCDTCEGAGMVDLDYNTCAPCPDCNPKPPN